MSRPRGPRGHIEGRAALDGRVTFRVVLELGPSPETGKRKRRVVSGFGSRQEAQRVLRRLLVEIEEDRYVDPSRLLLASFLRERWLPSMRPTVRPATWANYRMDLEAYVIPRIGGVALQQLNPAMLAGLYGELLEDGHKRGGGLSPRSVRLIHTILKRALKDASRWGLTIRNIADDVDPPRVPRSEKQAWTSDELARFLEHAAGDRMAGAWRLSATTGLRRGELLALRWSDVHSDRVEISRGLVIVEGVPTFAEPKTSRARRSVALDAVTVAALREHRKRQTTEQLAWKGAYQQLGLVFSREDGSPVRPERFSRRFDDLVAQVSGLRRISLHGLRHTWATLALRAGVNPKVVSDRLGHSTIAVTLDAYSHVIPALQAEAAEQVASLIDGVTGTSEGTSAGA